MRILQMQGILSHGPAINGDTRESTAICLLSSCSGRQALRQSIVEITVLLLGRLLNGRQTIEAKSIFRRRCQQDLQNVRVMALPT
jgi:hypothetical protein